MMNTQPEVKRVEGGMYWEHTFEDFKVKVYTPDNDLLGDIINYAFVTPYVIVFEPEDLSVEEEIDLSEREGFTKFMKEYAGSVVFVYPTNEGGWKQAPADIYKKLLDESRIGEFHENGCLRIYNRFTKKQEGFCIKGAVHRPFVFGFGDAAEYVAKNLLKKTDGNFLWGPGEITPVLCGMKGLKAGVAAQADTNNNNSDNKTDNKTNNKTDNKTDIILSIIGEDETFEQVLFENRLRMRILGNMEEQADHDAMGLRVETGFEKIKTSSDNMGQFWDTHDHIIGYVTYVSKSSLDEARKCGKKLPTVMAFHGGGDSAMIIASFSSGWDQVCNKYGFLLICVENHLNVSATETIELIEKLKEKYPIDPERIYATGFSMGGIKSWDMFQEYPSYFAAIAPMSATVEPGENVFFSKSPRLNEDTPLPVFYVGGEKSPLAELAFQEKKCLNRLKYVLKVNNANKAEKANDVSFEDRESWENAIWAINGDKTLKLASPDKEGRVMTLELFESSDGNIYTVFGSINDQQHEVHFHQCEEAYKFMSCFRRSLAEAGKLICEKRYGI